MPELDLRGKIAAAQIAAYVPIAIITIILVFKYAFRRDGGWFFLFWFALIRVAGGACIVAGEMLDPTIVDLFIVAYLLFPVGLAFLMTSTIGFLGLAGQHTYSEHAKTTHWYRFIAGLNLIAVALATAGGLLGTHVNPDANTGMILRRVAAGILAAVYVLLVIAHFASLTHRHFIRSYRRKVLYGLFVALPFLGVRVAYGILAAWSSSDQFGTQLSSNPTFARFNPITGEWLPFLIMGMVMEFCVAVIYLVSSTILSRRRR